MNVRFRQKAVLFLVALLALGACASPQETGDQIATIVAATMQAQVVPTLTSSPIDGEILPEIPSAFGDCDNTGQINVAYIKDSNVWLWVQGGMAVQLTNSGDAQDLRISQDGCLVAYSRSVPNPGYAPAAEELAGPESIQELWVVSSDGSRGSKVAGQEFYDTLPEHEAGSIYTLHRFDWRPGTHTLAFSTRLAYTGPGLVPNRDIFLANGDDLSITPLLPAGQGGDFYFSPDGEQIAFTTATNVSVINVDGSNLRGDVVSFPNVITYSEYEYYPPVHWGQDSNSFMLAIPPADGLEGPVDGVYPETTLWYVPLHGTPPIEAGAVQTAWFVTQEVQFSPDNGRIAYIRQYGELEAGQFELVLALSDGSNESLGLQINEIMFGDWSPDNTRFIYWFNQAGVFQMFHGSAGSLDVAPISTLTPFEAASAEIEWVQGDTFVLLLMGNAGAELSLMETSGAGTVIDTMSVPFISFDVAN